MEQKKLFYLVTAACALALVVVILGAYTRLSNAGLGCPDWPGCYGHITVPTKLHTLTQVHKDFPGQIVVAEKAWKEMIHRYAAGTLGLLILSIAVFAWRKRYLFAKPKKLPFVLCGLVVFQAALGMWTVTLKLLPLVVMGHLLGGITILSLLWCLRLQLQTQNDSVVKSMQTYRPWLIIAIIMTAVQIALGGWVGANYAGVSCIGFPYCNGELIPKTHLLQAFNFFSPIGANYEGGVLNSEARASIQMVHRLWAYITAAYLCGLMGFVLQKNKMKKIQRLACLVLLLLVAQIVLGIFNVIWMLPLAIAVMHNANAVLLLLSLVTLTAYSIKTREIS